MTSMSERDDRRFLHERKGALNALGFAVLFFGIHLVPFHGRVIESPLWINHALVFVWLPLMIAAMAILVWWVRSFWESIFLGIILINIVLEVSLPIHSAIVFRHAIALLWGSATLIAAVFFFLSYKTSKSS